MRTHKTPEQRLHKLDAALGLSPAQHQQAKQVLVQAAQARAQAPTWHARKALRAQTHNQLRALLEPHQQEAFAQHLEQRRAHRLARRLERMDKALDLSPQQHTQIKELLEQTPHPATTSTPEDERASRHAQIMAVLNADQRDLYQAHLAQRRHHRSE